jgi:hypothetical protein
MLSNHMNEKLLAKLKQLQKARGDIRAFTNHDEFLPWSDNVSPLLEFDNALHKKFIFWSDHVKSAYRLGREHHDALGEAIGVVNQAIIKLEIQEEKLQEKKPEAEIPYPDKITLKWLSQHAPLSLWAWLLSILSVAFILGITFSETPLYKSLKPQSELAIENKPKT